MPLQSVTRTALSCALSLASACNREERADKERLKELSKKSVAGWSNTIAGQRQARLQAKAQREAELELRKQEIDLEEAAYQAEERKKAIERAKVRRPLVEGRRSPLGEREVRAKQE